MLKRSVKTRNYHKNKEKIRIMYKTKPKDKIKLTECFLNIRKELEALYKDAKAVTEKQESKVKAEHSSPVKKRK